MKLFLSQIARITGDKWFGSDVWVSGISTDTRTLHPGDLFVAIEGPNYDGNHFVQEALALGASAVMSRCMLASSKVSGVVVNDSVAALGKLAQAVRLEQTPCVVAITGSNGKTTVKEMLASILSQTAATLKTRGNLNNHIGLPLTLLRLTDEAYVVAEMGASHSGEIADLTAIAQPDVGIVTMAGEAHLGGFGSREAIARAKGELFAGLRPGTIAIINADDPWYELWCEMASHCRIVRFGMSSRADVRAVKNEHGGWQIMAPDGEFELQLALPGEHNVRNALCAAAAAVALEVPTELIASGLRQADAIEGRLNEQKSTTGHRIIDDTYNANPGSFSAALAYLKQFSAEKWMVVGEMGELGETALEYHRLLGDDARLSGVTRLFGLGHLSRATVDAFGSGGQWYANIEALIEDLNNLLTKKAATEVVVLVKGSRFMQMERVVHAICSVPDKPPVGGEK